MAGSICDVLDKVRLLGTLTADLGQVGSRSRSNRASGRLTDAPPVVSPWYWSQNPMLWCKRSMVGRCLLNTGS